MLEPVVDIDITSSSKNKLNFICYVNCIECFDEAAVLCADCFYVDFTEMLVSKIRFKVSKI